jgi:hypothetical protein
MTTRPRSLIPLAVVAAFLMVGLAACSGGPASVKNATDDPTTEESEPADEEPCDAVATVYGTTYHVVQVASQDYGVKPDVQLEGEATDCEGTTTRPMTFHAIPEVDPSWALCGLVDGRWRVFLSDTLGPVPADSVLAHIVVGR